jgi:hypothetical protein
MDRGYKKALPCDGGGRALFFSSFEGKNDGYWDRKIHGALHCCYESTPPHKTKRP